MSPKSDIYSLGIIVKELVTGSKEKPDITKVSCSVSIDTMLQTSMERGENGIKPL